MEIREFGEEELEKLLRLYTELHNNPFPAMDGRVRSVWGDILADPNHHVLGVFEGERAVSSCVLLIIPNLTHGQRPYALIENVITAEKDRGLGYATALLLYAEKFASEKGCYKIMLMTGSKEEKTLRFYSACGLNCCDKTAFVRWL